ncbi:XRE family transcriptional regulator [uncultured Endozoicomonas sp.]|uniref:LexA family protein n=1 Tax=uncultured Endozoicomonas sp. TaxID=432652 RepID=UPI00262706F9|nr:XRE family transcriptional regulator [uncultured Endozoicomonas sp.]
MVESDIAHRISVAIERSGKSQRKVAIEIGVTPQAITKWLKTGNISRESLDGLAKATGVSASWLLSGIGSMDRELDYNVVPLPNNRKVVLVPLISWVQAGDFCETPGATPAEYCEDLLPCPVPIGSRGYALTVQGESMTSPYPNDRSYPPGCIIYVDPDKPVTNGCRVVAHIDGTDEVTFKTYIEDAGHRFLKPINPQFKTIDITKNTRICGVVVCKMTPE